MIENKIIVKIIANFYTQKTRDLTEISHIRGIEPGTVLQASRKVVDE